MPISNANANWEGGLKNGQGRMSLGSGAYEGNYSFGTRMEGEPGTNPEELVGAALAGCFSMALSATLEKEGTTPNSIRTDARVHFNKEGEGFAIQRIDLTTDADIDGMDDARFQEIAQKVKDACPVSKALTGTTINLEARLSSARAAG